MPDEDDVPAGPLPSWVAGSRRRYPDVRRNAVLLKGAPSARLTRRFTTGRSSRLVIND